MCESVYLCTCLCQVVGRTGRCWQMQLDCAHSYVCVFVCVCVGGVLHLDTAGVCGSTVANSDPFPCQTFNM